MMILNTYTLTLVIEAKNNPKYQHVVKRTLRTLSYDSAKRMLTRSYLREGWFVRYVF